MTSEYNLVLNPNKCKSIESGIVLSQGDFGAVFKIKVEELDTASTTCTIAFRKKSGSVEATGLTASAGVYSYALRGTELDTPGRVVCDLKFKEGTSKRISTASFIFDVVPDTLNGLHEEAHSYSDSIQQMREQIVEEARADLVKPMTYKGVVASVSNLPASGNANADFYIVSSNEHIYVWNGTIWTDAGPAVTQISIIDDNVIGDNTTWSSSKINRDLTDIAKYYDGITSTLGSFPDDKHKGYNRIGTLVVVNCSFKPNSNIAIDSIAITGFPKSIGRMPVFILDYDNTAITGFGAIDYGGRFRNYITLTANHTYMLSGIYEDLEAR